MGGSGALAVVRRFLRAVLDIHGAAYFAFDEILEVVKECRAALSDLRSESTLEAMHVLQPVAKVLHQNVSEARELFSNFDEEGAGKIELSLIGQLVQVQPCNTLRTRIPRSERFGTVYLCRTASAAMKSPMVRVRFVCLNGIPTRFRGTRFVF